jgi:ketosteroid isomerase-like protein
MDRSNATPYRNTKAALAAVIAVLLHSTTPALATDTTPAVNTGKGNKTMTTQDLLDTYYAGLQQKSGWDSTIADDFQFIGGNNMTKPDPLVGKAAYQALISRFSRVFTAMRVKDMVVAGDRAYALTNYDYSWPNGRTANGDVIEVWRVKDHKLAALTIYFDTLSFDQLTK